MTNIIPFKNRQQIEQEKRDKVWSNWLKWEKFEEECRNFHENDESDIIFEPDKIDDTLNNALIMSESDLAFVQYEERLARKEMMRNKESNRSKKLELSPAELEWLSSWIKKDD